MANSLYKFVKKHNISKALFVSYVVGFSLILYFVFYTIFGAKGLFTLKKLNKEVENKEITKQKLIDKMDHKKNMIKGMSPESLDLDLLDEQSRRVLGYVGKNEIVIYKEDQNQKENQK